VKSADDVLLTASRPVPILAAGASSTATVTLSSPVATALGSYYVLACADAANAVVEASETNNCRASATAVQVTRPDLAVAALGDPPAVAAPGGGFAVTDTVRNQGIVGSLGSTTGYYPSLPTRPGGADDLRLSGSRPVPDPRGQHQVAPRPTRLNPMRIHRRGTLLGALPRRLLVILKISQRR